MVPTRLPQLGMFPRRVALEPGRTEVLWAEAVRRPGGTRLRACGRVPCKKGEKPRELLARLAGTRWLRDAEVSVAIRHPDMDLQRLELPAISRSAARNVAQRRVDELADSTPESRCGGFVIAGGSGPRSSWLATCPEEVAGFTQERWVKQGLRVSHLGSTQLALGSLVRILPAQEDGSLVAFLDISNAHAICVLADSSGWAFGREIPIKAAGSNAAQEEDNSFERLGTELRRTFQYVDSEQQAGTVRTLVLSGARPGLRELAEQLADQLEMEVRLIGEAISEGPAAGADPALATVIGLAVERQVGTANLLPPAPLREVVRRRATRGLVAATFVPVLLLLLIGGRTLHLGSSLYETQQLLDGRWNEGSVEREGIEADARERQAGDDLLTASHGLSRPRPVFSALLRSLGHLLPPDSFVMAFEADSREADWQSSIRVEFRGSDLAAAMRAASNFAEALDRSPLWRVGEVEREPAPRGGGSKSGPDTVVQAHYRVEAQPALVRRALAQAKDGQSAPSAKGGDRG